jgi:hypothetical protein
MKTMTASELKYQVEQHGKEPFYFTRKTMQLFGDTMRNYGVSGPLQIVNNMGKTVPAWELFRRKPVKFGNSSSAYFNAVTFEREFPKQ